MRRREPDRHVLAELRLTRILLVWTVPTLLTLTGCAGNDTEPRGSSGSAPGTWVCRLGTQGGFTGGGNGIEIHSDGRVLSWSRMTAQADVETEALGTATARQLQRLQQALDAPELASIQLRQTSNMTTFVQVQRSGERLEWSWPADRMGGRTPKVPDALRRVHETAHAIADQVRGAQ